MDDLEQFSFRTTSIDGGAILWTTRVTEADNNEGPRQVASCNDGEDNDEDGLIDADDPVAKMETT